jgi:hypothetical protein
MSDQVPGFEVTGACDTRVDLVDVMAAAPDPTAHPAPGWGWFDGRTRPRVPHPFMLAVADAFTEAQVYT